MNTLLQCCRLHRSPYESEINEEMEAQYNEMQEDRDIDDDDDDVQEVENKLQELEQKMEASNERLEGRIDASSTRLEAKIDDSHQRLEMMIRQLLDSQTSSTPQPHMELPVPTTPVLLQVTLEYFSFLSSKLYPHKFYSFYTYRISLNDQFMIRCLRRCPQRCLKGCLRGCRKTCRMG